jgi:polyisoprenoid-binding protein YceI
MKHTQLHPPAIVLSLLLLVATCRAEDCVRFTPQAGSQVKIDGTSNIHNWTVTGQIIRGWMEVSAAFASDLKTLSSLPRVEVIIPVRTLKSRYQKMDEVMQEHMRMAQHTNITYRLTGLLLQSESKDSQGPAHFISTGELTVAGVKQTIEMPVTIERVDTGRLRVKGTIPLKMTQFKIQPPSPIITANLIKTGDDVTVAVDWLLAQAKREGER